MRPVIRYQSQLLYRKSYKPNRIIRIRPAAKPNFIFRPMRRFGSSRNWNSSRSSRAERPPDKRKTAERYRAGRPFSHSTLTKGTTMKLAKALKLKNQLAGEVAQLKELLGKQNVRSSKQKFDYDNREVLTRLRAKLDELVRVKAALAVANAEIYAKIFRLAELKGLVATLTALETKRGVFREGRGYGEATYEVEYVAQLGKVDVDKLVAESQNETQTLQGAIRECNCTRPVNEGA